MVLSFASVILWAGFGGKRPWRRAVAESKTGAPSPPTLTRTATSERSTRSEWMPRMYEDESASR